MRILTNSYPWALAAYRRNRERKVHREVISLNEQYPDLEFHLIDSLLAAAVGNISFGLHALSAKLLRKLPSPNVYFAVSVNGPYWYFASQRMNYVPLRLLKAKGIDLFFAHEYFPVNFSCNTVPIVYDTRMPTEACIEAYKPRLTNPLELTKKRHHFHHYCGKQSTLITLTSPGDAARYADVFPDLASKVRTVPWYVPDLDPADRSAVLSKHQEDNSDPLRILFVGNDGRRKGLPELIDGLALLTDEERATLEVTAVTNFHDGHIDTTNSGINMLSSIPFSHVQKLMAESHVFLFPTKGDTYGLVVMEAMAAGCAVISSNREPQDWFLDMGRAGLLVEPTEPESIACALRDMMGNPEKRRLMAVAAYERFLSVYHHKAVGRQLRDVFYEAVDLWQLSV